MTSNTKLSFSLETDSRLPKLAWCVHIDRHTTCANLRSGPWVEVNSSSFIAGAWGGDFATRDFDRSAVQCGTAGKVVEQGWIFSPASHALEWLHVVTEKDKIWLSNSLAFLMSELDDAADINYDGYFFDLLKFYRRGLREENKHLRTFKGRIIKLWVYDLLLVKPDLSLEKVPRMPPDTPVDFNAYRELLTTGASLVTKNASDHARRFPYKAKVTVSSGYDSTAAAVIAAETGCKDALTFLNSSRPDKPGLYPDSGIGVCDVLGMRCKSFNREDIRLLEGKGDHYFFYNPWMSTCRSMMIMHEELEASLLFTGRNGEDLWNKNGRGYGDHLQIHQSYFGSGFELAEYSLHAGFIHFPLPYLGKVHARKIKQISKSSEMARWSTGTDYDRPIARRIGEEAGLERSSFGWIKYGGGGPAKELHENTKGAFEKFCTNRGIHSYRHRLPESLRKLLFATELRLRAAPKVAYFLDYCIGFRLHPLWKSKKLYLFHWGLERTKMEYPRRRKMAE